MILHKQKFVAQFFPSIIVLPVVMAINGNGNGNGNGNNDTSSKIISLQQIQICGNW